MRIKFYILMLMVGVLILFTDIVYADLSDCGNTLDECTDPNETCTQKYSECVATESNTAYGADFTTQWPSAGTCAEKFSTCETVKANICAGKAQTCATDFALFCGVMKDRCEKAEGQICKKTEDGGESTGECGADGSSQADTAGGGGAVVPTGPAASVDVLVNPLGGSTGNPTGINNIPQLVGKIIGVALGFLGSLALLFFVYGGFTWMMSRGNPTEVQKGTKTLLWATIGIVLVFSSYTLVIFLIGAIGA